MTMSLERLLSNADPAIGRAPVSADAPEARAALDDVLSGRDAPVPASRRSRRMLVAMVGAAAAILAASVFAIAPDASSPSGTAAAATLLRLSIVAGAQPALLPTRPGQYYFTSFEYSQAVTINGGCAIAHCEPVASTFAIRFVYVEEFWVRPGGLVRIRVVRTSPSLVATTRVGWLASGRPSIARLLPRTFSEIVRPMRHAVSPATALLSVQHLPTSPANLSAALDAGPLGGPSYDTQNKFNALATILGTGGASPALRAAVFKVLATIPGVRDLGMVRDALGRRGDAFEVAPGHRYACDTTSCPTSEMVIDPASGTLLAEASLNPIGRPMWTTYLSIGIASSLGSLPPVKR
jgi:hypothetical protein